MPKTIFFSWQSDTPSSNGRTFLKNVLDLVCKNIARDTTIDEALRGDIEVDSDTQGVAGHPPIFNTILNKIDEAAVVVVDLTFTAKRIDGRPSPNPNVLIEYGWALKSLDNERVIWVTNEAYGQATRESLPFDLGHMRLPIRYNLSEDASPEEKKKVKETLTKELQRAILSSLGTLPIPKEEEPEKFHRHIPLNTRAQFRAPTTSIGFDEEIPNKNSPVEIFLTQSPAMMWLRLMPRLHKNHTWTSHQLKEQLVVEGKMNLKPLMNQAKGYNFLRAEDGVGIYTPVPGTSETTSSYTGSVAFAFNTGEIWSTDTEWLEDRNCIPYIEKIFAESLKSYVKFLKGLGIDPPYDWQAGMVGIKGWDLEYPLKPGYFRFPGEHLCCVSNEVFCDGEYTEGENPMTALLPFFVKLFDACGIDRTKHLSLGE